MLIKFLAYKGTDWLARIIRHQTQSDYSHIAYIWSDKYAVECWPDHWYQLLNVRWSMRPIFKGYKRNDEYEVWGLEVSEGQACVIHNFFLYLVEKKAKFDYVAGLGLFAKWRRERKGRYFCSEGCITPLVKVFGWDHVFPWKVTPEVFVQIIQAAGGRLIERGRVNGRSLCEGNRVCKAAQAVGSRS